MKFCLFMNISNLHTLDNEMTALLKFFKISTEMYFASLFFLNERNIATSLLMIHLKWTLVHYANLNSNTINKPHLRAVKYAFSFFFDFFFIFILATLLSKNLWKNYYYKFPKFVSRCSILQNIRMSNFVMLKWRPFEYKTKSQKKHLLFRSKIRIFDIFFKGLCEGSFEDLQINDNLKFQTDATVSHELAAL